MTPLFCRTTSWGQLRSDIKFGDEKWLRPTLVWGRSVEDIENGLYGIPFKTIACAEIRDLATDIVAIIRDPDERNLRLASLCCEVRSLKRRAPTFIPVIDFCRTMRFPFPINAITHLRFQTV